MLSEGSALSAVFEWLRQYPVAFRLIGILVVAVAVTLGYLIAKRYLLRAVAKLVLRTDTQWDDALHHHKVFERLAYLVPGLIIHYGIQFVPGIGENLSVLIQRAAIALIILAAAFAVGAFLTAANEIYATHEISKTRPIKGYIQIAKIVLYAIASIAGVAVLVGQSPLLFLSGIGAMTAVLMLIFKDTLLALVASVQITSTDMIRLGDWIEMPQFGADGDVVDIALHTVKIQNFDKTITTIPTAKLIDGSFKNWRGMSESGGRRIKRTINIDMNTVRFLTDEDIERFERFALLADYIRDKKSELDNSNRGGKAAAGEKINLRRLTNMGTFRAYVVNYLRSRAQIHKGMTLLVRQRDPTPEGVPIEIYTFSNITEWVAYESLQSDIFDHLMAAVPEFGLRVFQNPSSNDFSSFLGSRSAGGTS